MAKRIIGLDLGTKTLGIAMSDPSGIIATGLETFRFQEKYFNLALAHLAELAKQYEISLFVIGLPRHMNGDIGEKANTVLSFKQRLEELLGIPVVAFDERMTTMIATRYLLEADLSRSKRKKVIDKMAAVEILQNYLDSPK